jgi:ribosomal protein S14
MLAELPAALTRNLADARAEVVSWSARTQELALHICKDIGTEQGVLRFFGVSRVELAPRLTLAGIAVGHATPGGRAAEPGDTVFHLHDAWGDGGYAIAERLTYAVAAPESGERGLP